MLLAFGTLLPTCVKAAAEARGTRGSTSASSTPASAKPLDKADGFAGRRGSAASSSPSRKARWKAASAAPFWKRPTAPGWTRATSSASASPDRFIEHAERGELLADLGLDVTGICNAIRSAWKNAAKRSIAKPSRGSDIGRPTR